MCPQEVTKGTGTENIYLKWSLLAPVQQLLSDAINDSYSPLRIWIFDNSLMIHVWRMCVLQEGLQCWTQHVWHGPRMDRWGGMRWAVLKKSSIWSRRPLSFQRQMEFLLYLSPLFWNSHQSKVENFLSLKLMCNYFQFDLLKFILRYRILPIID